MPRCLTARAPPDHQPNSSKNNGSSRSRIRCVPRVARRRGRCARRRRRHDQAHGRFEPIDDARLGRHDAHLVVPELEQAARGARSARTESAGRKPTAARSTNTTNTLEAVEIGLTDMGWVGTLWELSKLPLQNVTYYVPFSTDDYRMVVDDRQRAAPHRARDDGRVDRAEPEVPRARARSTRII